MQVHGVVFQVWGHAIQTGGKRVQAVYSGYTQAALLKVEILGRTRALVGLFHLLGLGFNVD